MIDKVIKTVTEHNMFSVDDCVGVGLSGGADSVTLLHILLKYRERLNLKKIIAIHIHHGIRGSEADRDLEFCKKLCSQLDVELVVYMADVPSEAKKTGESIEECARRIRYQVFDSSPCDKITTAHNLNDNMETVILNMCRGSSVSGLCGIPYVRDKYVRPFLDCSRKEIEEYANENGLSFVVDSTNLYDEYNRNKVRHNVLPVLYSLNPSLDKSFSRLLESVYLANDYINECAEEILNSARKDGYYDCLQIVNSHRAVKNQIISLILKENNVKNINRRQIDDIAGVISNSGKITLYDGKILNVIENKLFFGKKEPIENFELNVDLSQKEIDSPIGKYTLSVVLKKDLQKLNKKSVYNLIDYDKILNGVVFRNKKDGDSYIPLRRGMTKTLKKLFNECKIPVYERSKMAILSDDKGIIWTEHFGVAQRCASDDTTKKYIIVNKSGE